MSVNGAVPFVGVSWISVHCRGLVRELLIEKEHTTDLIHPTVLGHGTIVDYGCDAQLWWERYVTACRRGGRRDDCVCRLTTASVSELVEHADLILSTRSERNGPTLQNCELYGFHIFEART